MTTAATDLAIVLDRVRAGAAARDADPTCPFPEAPIVMLEEAGVLAATVTEDGLAYAEELWLLRTIAAADAGVARIVDGHLNAVERLRVQAPAALAVDELEAIAGGARRAGVWGADPGPGEGEPARLRDGVVNGAKTFCSGAGGLQRALVLVRGEAEGPPLAAWLDLTPPGVAEVDGSWFHGAGMRSSASHRVVFHDAPVLVVLGEPGALSLQPWFARDAIRTAATWAGAADAAVDDALDRLAARPGAGELEALAAGRLLTWREAIGLWLARAAVVLDSDPEEQLAGEVSARARVAIADAARAILDEAERALGSRPASTGAVLDRAARDLRLFLLQHRLEPILARTGETALEARR